MRFPNAVPPAEYKCRFRALTDLYYGPKFCKKIRAGEAKDPVVSLKCMVLGETEATAKPWIVVFCAKEIVGKVKSFFAKSERRKDFQPHNGEPDEPCLNVAVYDRAPIATNLDGVPDVFCNLLTTTSDSLCGQLIRVGTGEGARVCTIGGLVEVKKSGGPPLLYGMTTAHGIFSRTEEEAAESDMESSDSEEEEPADSDIDDLDADCCDSDNEYFPPKDSLTLSREVSSQSKPTNHYLCTNLDCELGKMVHFSLDADWALFNVKPEFEKPNRGPNNSILKAVEAVRDFNCVAPRPATICGRKFGGLLGTITSTSFCILPGSKTMVEVFDLRLESGQST